ncbi:hypothetical protein QFZ79_003892 [Arthrobacter sp. V4I6]|nr:hypothetical protein [Arthrobacter sp. V1I7]MDQ0855781.1 hypothetical protein [Arthrobacter sp. V4I6]
MTNEPIVPVVWVRLRQDKADEWWNEPERDPFA